MSHLFKSVLPRTPFSRWIHEWAGVLATTMKENRLSLALRLPDSTEAFFQGHVSRAIGCHRLELVP